MENCRALKYPARLRIAWADGSTDRTPNCWPLIGSVLHNARRGAKTAALNRALEHPHPIIFTDANTSQPRSRGGDRAVST